MVKTSWTPDLNEFPEKMVEDFKRFNAIPVRMFLLGLLFNGAFLFSFVIARDLKAHSELVHDLLNVKFVHDVLNVVT